MRTVALVAFTLTLMLGLAVPALAHTELSSTTPEMDAVAVDPPQEVVLEFSEALQPGSEPAVRVVDPLGDDLVSAPPVLDGGTVTVPLNLAVAPGAHQVDWVVTADDGDEQRGSFTFSFQPAPVPTAEPVLATPTPIEPAPTATPTPIPSEATPTPTASVEATPLAAADGGGSGLGGVAVGIAVLAAAAGGFVLIRRRGSAPEDF